jgi:hypothetical protein
MRTEHKWIVDASRVGGLRRGHLQTQHEVINHLVTIHKFIRRDFYIIPVNATELHTYEHTYLQSSLDHFHTHHWNGKAWVQSLAQPESSWQKVGPGLTIGERDLADSLFALVRAFGASTISVRLHQNS